MDYEKKYKEALYRAREALNDGTISSNTIAYLQDIFPELADSEDERIRKKLISLVKNWDKGGIVSKYTSDANEIKLILAWLEKQGEPSIKWNKNTKENKPQVNHSVLMKTTHGIAEGEWNGGEHWIQYRWSSSVKDSDVLSWMELSDLDKQDGHGYAKLSEENDIDEEYKVGKWFIGLIPCWINAPSTLQPEHSNHGKNVVAIHLKGGGYRCCCIDDKKPRVFDVAENTPFEEGWRINRRSAKQRW